MNSAVVTGAKGFLGAQMVRELLCRGVRVTAIASQPPGQGRILPESSTFPVGGELAGSRGTMPEDHIRLTECGGLSQCGAQGESGQLTYIQADLSDFQTVRALRLEHCPDVFFHFAWRGASGPGRQDCQLQMENVAVTLECLQMAKRLGCKRFIGAGSLMEREVSMLAARPEKTVEPRHLYSAAKLAAHHMAFPLATSLDVELVWGVITNMYGPGELSARFLVTTLQKMVNGEPLDFTTAAQWYDFLHVADGAKAFCDLAERGRAFAEYTVGSGDVRRLRDFICAMDQLAGGKSRLRFGTAPMQGVDLPKSAFDITALKRDTGFQPEIRFEDGVADMLQKIKTGG